MKSSSGKVAVVFLLTAVLCSLIIGITVFNRISVERLAVEQLMSDLPDREWYEYPETWVMLLLGVGISALAALVTYKSNELRILEDRFEYMAQADSLTGIFDKRHFMEVAVIQLERTERLSSDSFIIFFDIDKLKDTNDIYGNQAENKMVSEITYRVRNTIRPYDLFARYSEEKFIILASDIKRREVGKLAERVRRNLSGKPIEIEGASITTDSRFGIVRVESAIDLDAAIGLAGKALGKAKQEGGSKVVFYERGDMGDTLYF